MLLANPSRDQPPRANRLEGAKTPLLLQGVAMPGRSQVVEPIEIVVPIVARNQMKRWGVVEL